MQEFREKIGWVSTNYYRKQEEKYRHKAQEVHPEWNEAYYGSKRDDPKTVAKASTLWNRMNALQSREQDARHKKEALREKLRQQIATGAPTRTDDPVKDALRGFGASMDLHYAEKDEEKASHPLSRLTRYVKGLTSRK